MAKLIDKLWNWGHLEGSHNKCTGLDCHMTPEEFAEEYGIRRAFMVSYGGNIQPPFDHLAKRFAVLDEVKWSVLGDASTPMPEDELGNTKDILAALDAGAHITGGIVDDFFSPKRLDRFTPEVLAKIKSALNARGLDFWCVLYSHQLDKDLTPYLDCFDGVTFWFWGCRRMTDMRGDIERLRALIGDKPLMLGVYLWDYGGGARPMDPARFEEELQLAFDGLRSGEFAGVVFCSSTVGDADLDTNRMLKEYIIQFGNDAVPE
ncbi:MAG: hypothetical protein E7662_06235 [Ruminococcaceae bacterium]|nr:hypothetical protein [Oscillospiraceae bacterium]